MPLDDAAFVFFTVVSMTLTLATFPSSLLSIERMSLMFRFASLAFALMVTLPSRFFSFLIFSIFSSTSDASMPASMWTLVPSVSFTSCFTVLKPFLSSSHFTETWGSNSSSCLSAVSAFSAPIIAAWKYASIADVSSSPTPASLMSWKTDARSTSLSCSAENPRLSNPSTIAVTSKPEDAMLVTSSASLATSL